VRELWPFLFDDRASAKQFHAVMRRANVRKSDVEKRRTCTRTATAVTALASRWWGFLRGLRRGFGLDLLLLLDYGPDLAFQRSKHAISG
jgi:hypothetical protein